MRLMPRKMFGRAIRMIDELMVAIRVPRVVFERAIHLYRSGRASARFGDAGRHAGDRVSDVPSGESSGSRSVSPISVSCSR